MERKSWFQTWDRPEYIEWAQPIEEGYLLIVARKQPNNWLLAKAKLTFKEEGLPGVEVIESRLAGTSEEAFATLGSWKSETG